MHRSLLVRSIFATSLCALLSIPMLCADDDDGLCPNGTPLPPDTGIDTTDTTGPFLPLPAEQVLLTANASGTQAGTVNANLVNPWGLIFDPNGNAWIAANGTGRIVILDTGGAQVTAPLGVPSRDGEATGAPTGLVLNTTDDFDIPGTVLPAVVIVATEDGLLTAYRSGDSATIVFTGDEDASYTGLALATANGNNYLYAANFGQRRIDVFDTAFNPVPGAMFIDNTIPEGYSPFNIVNINGDLFVTYAEVSDGEVDDDVGDGFVNVFNAAGNRISRFASQGPLNAPWGVAMTTTQFNAGAGFQMDPILIDNFGDGNINVYDDAGNFLGQLNDSTGTAIVIPELRALVFPRDTNLPDAVQMRVYFTAAPADETQGRFGYLIPMIDTTGTDTTGIDTTGTDTTKVD